MNNQSKKTIHFSYPIRFFLALVVIAAAGVLVLCASEYMNSHGLAPRELSALILLILAFIWFCIKVNRSNRQP